MKKLATLLGIVLITTSCLKLEGNLKVSESISVKEKYGLFNSKTRTITVAPGKYEAALKIKDEDSFVLKLEKGGKTIDVPIKLDKEIDLPRNGKFSVAHGKTSVGLNLNGTVETEVESSGITDTTESCTIESRHRICERVCSRETRRCDNICRDIVTISEGHRDVAYHYDTTTTRLELELSKANSTAVAAEFNGKDVSTQRINDHYGSCRLGRR
jgi:hypothetical protein